MPYEGKSPHESKSSHEGKNEQAGRYPAPGGQVPAALTARVRASVR